MWSLIRQMAGVPEVGELCKESFIFEDVTWKIPGVFSLPTYVDYKVDSHAFNFASATWCLRMYPNGQTGEGTQGFIDLLMVRLHSLVPKHEVTFKICFKTRRDKEFECYCSSGSIEANGEELGVINYLKQSRLMSKRDLIAPNGTVTVSCQMRTKKVAAVEAYSQTELVGSTENEKEKSEGGRNDGVESSTQTEAGFSVDIEVPLPVSADDNKLLQDLKELLLSEEDSDVTIKVKGQEFRAHRAILKARSSVFSSMFKHDTKEKATGVIDVEDCEPAIFPDFLHFLYCGSVEKLSAENVFGLYTAADKYDVQGLKSECVVFMKNNLSVDTFCDTITLSLQHCETELIKLATDFFGENMPKIIVTVKWQTFLTENPIQSNELMIKAMASYKRINT